jgi:uncharacterized protein (DUF1501 family)
MFNRRELLKGMLQGAPLLALASSVPPFLARTALAAADSAKNKDKILVVVELAGGNDGLNMLVPYGDDLYHKARRSLRIGKDEVIRIDDHVGLNPTMKPLEKLLADQRLALVQGVGYPNPNRSHFEAMDIWHTADPSRRSRAGWLGQATGLMPATEGKAPALNLNSDKLPLALQGGSGGVLTINPNHGYGLELGAPLLQGNPVSYTPAPTPPPAYPKPHSSADGSKAAPGTDSVSIRKRLIHDLTAATPGNAGSMADFVRRTALESYSTADRLNAILSDSRRGNGYGVEPLTRELQTVATMIDADFGARIYFLSLGGFDTHADQRKQQDALLGQLANAVEGFYGMLLKQGHADRVLLMTFSEFGRRVEENGSGGTDHGAASSLLLAGGGVKGGLIGQAPKLDDLDDGDIKFHTDFRRVYATILEDWLNCDSHRMLGDRWEKLPLFRNA